MRHTLLLEMLQIRDLVTGQLPILMDLTLLVAEIKPLLFLMMIILVVALPVLKYRHLLLALLRPFVIMESMKTWMDCSIVPIQIVIVEMVLFLQL